VTKSPYLTTEAGHKFLELYAEPVVTNTYLKVALLVLAIVALALLALLYRAETAASRLKPLVISVSDVGRGQFVSYADFSKVPTDKVSKYYLARWATLYYGRNHATLQRDFSESLSFLSNELQSATLSRVNKQKILETFLLDPGALNVDIDIKAVVLEDLRQSPYRAHVEFDKVYRSPGDQQEQRCERWTANVVYGFRDEVPNQMLLTNPLGLVISYVHEDQAFGSQVLSRRKPALRPRREA
jgi:type IV secretion system protein VirB5